MVFNHQMKASNFLSWRTNHHQPGPNHQKLGRRRSSERPQRNSPSLHLLPTGSVLLSRFFSPSFTHDGKCKSIVSRTTTLGLLSFCAASCFVLCFTDSFRDERGKVRYGLATFRGLWVIDGSASALPPQEADKFRLRFVDFFHAFMSILVFAAVAMLDKNVIHCFYPSPSDETFEILTTLPVLVGDGLQPLLPFCSRPGAWGWIPLCHPVS
ncbi:protein DMP7 [Sesamum alatum]|uniref:Protein DMP7 n=1 Tax=Sesamum alatum TaxID=300844 RepID=A0AAE1YZP7_9LAMI|nr:protein DMP7 [Sesamum alatum]